MGAELERHQPSVQRVSLRLPPPWVGNLLVFGFLIALTVLAFFLQTRAAEQRFIAAATAHSRLLADAVRLYAQSAVLAGEATDGILTAFLGNSARFVVYLDDIEPFTAEELASFADEAGLSMIRIQRGDSTINNHQTITPMPQPDRQHPRQSEADRSRRPPQSRETSAGQPIDTEAKHGDAALGNTSTGVQDPADHGQDLALPCAPLEQLRSLPDGGGFLFTVPRAGRPGCAMVVLRSPAVDALRAEISVQRALDSVGRLPQVRAVRLEGEPQPAPGRPVQTEAKPARARLIRASEGDTVAEVRAPIAGAELVLLLDGAELQQRRRDLWLAFAGFLLSLLAAGSLGTWLLVKVQAAHVRQLRDYERRLSVQREEASLGRAASTIAHEIRNPLNAIGLGLQRLQLEAVELKAPHRDLIERVMQAVQRTNGTISALLAYTRPGQQHRAPTDLTQLIEETLPLHQRLLEQRNVRVLLDLPPEAWINGDAEQLRRAIDNLLINAREALPEEGVLEIRLARDHQAWSLSITNDGLTPQTAPLDRLTEPWFTTKANSTGLGLAIVRRILSAHQGELSLDQPTQGRLRVRLRLPASP